MAYEVIVYDNTKPGKEIKFIGNDPIKMNDRIGVKVVDERGGVQVFNGNIRAYLLYASLKFGSAAPLPMFLKLLKAGREGKSDRALQSILDETWQEGLN